MRKHTATDSELKELLQAEIASFKALSKEKEVLLGLNMPVVELIEKLDLLKLKLADSVEEINHLHRKLYPNFPRGTCGNCGCPTMPILGSNAKMTGCIACGQEGVDWNL